MNAQHTVGPWSVLPDEEDVHYIRIRGTQLGERYKIANVWLPDYQMDSETATREHRESAANARLIAAAPDMLAALQMLMGPIDGLQANADAAKQARAAIAKATGDAA